MKPSKLPVCVAALSITALLLNSAPANLYAVQADTQVTTLEPDGTIHPGPGYQPPPPTARIYSQSPFDSPWRYLRRGRSNTEVQAGCASGSAGCADEAA